MTEQPNQITITKQDENNNLGEKLEIGDIVEHTAVDVMRHDPENPIPHSEIAGRPDAGFGGTRIRFTISLSNLTKKPTLDKLVEWVEDDQTATGFDFGVFSLSHTELPQFDKEANENVGYKLVNLHLEVSHQIPDRITGYLDMQLDGDVSG